MQESLQDAHKFKLWKNNLIENGLDIHEIKEVYTRPRHNGEVLFSLVMLDATTPEGKKIPPICFLKGTVISILICLIDKDTKEKYALLVKQRRICNGAMVYETVAGMVDKDDDPFDVAVKETEEETGLKIDPAIVHRLGDEPLYVSTGTSDEAMYFYYAELELSYEEIMSYHNVEQGIISEHEHIFTHVCPLADAKKLITNTNGLLNVHMYEDVLRERA
ncbi:MAG: NUDIX hydrolase [Bacteroidia bacterium]|nr:NUDIX hydrolase [Bacteroidia bacterium]